MATDAFKSAGAWSPAQKTAEGNRSSSRGWNGAGLTRISSPSLVSSRLQEVLGPSPFRSLCSHTILFSLSHFTKLCKETRGQRAHSKGLCK